MANSQKNTDCYFFYYSTCKKGNFCPFRHEPSALGCETTCRYWRQGSCIDEHCTFKHMELKKNRKSIPCFWETQPTDCRKPHCPFLHKFARNTTNDPTISVKVSEHTAKPAHEECSAHQEDGKFDGSSTESDQGRGSSEAGSFIDSPAVDPFIVEFEEESDSESIPSPVKPQPRVPYCKTYEEIRLEEIQAESAAYYSYEANDNQAIGAGKTKSVRTSKRLSPYPRIALSTEKDENTKEMDFRVLSLEEIRKRKERRAFQDNQLPTYSFIEQKSKYSSSGDAVRNIIDVNSSGVLKNAKRSFEECFNEMPTDNRNVKRRTADNPVATKVPPVRLRRSPKRLLHLSDLNGERRTVQKIIKQPSSGKLFPKEIEDSKVSDDVQEPKLQMKKSDSSTDDDHAHSNVRKSDVEIRLCDSSTDEDQAQAEKDDRKSVGTDTIDDAGPKTSSMPYDSLININDEDYLLDTTSADILKDIDALLTDKAGEV